MKTLRTKSKNLLGVKAFLIKHGYNTRAKVKSLIQERKLKADPSIVQELREWCGLDEIPEVILLPPLPANENRRKEKKKSTVKAKPKKKKPIPLYMTNHHKWDQVAVMVEICSQLSNTSMGLAYICREDDRLPTSKAVYEWLIAEIKKGGEKPLSDMYAQAKEDQADFMADEILDIADDGRNDYMDKLNKDGEVIGKQLDGEHVQRSRLRVDTRKWIASKLKPRKYGDKLELANNPERPLSSLSDEDLSATIAALTHKVEQLTV